MFRPTKRNPGAAATATGAKTVRPLEQLDGTDSILNAPGAQALGRAIAAMLIALAIGTPASMLSPGWRPMRPRMAGTRRPRPAGARQ